MIYLQFVGLIVFLGFYVWFFSYHRANKKRQSIIRTLESGAFVLDARSNEEFREHHYERAVNIPLEKIYQKKDKLPANLETPIVVYCRSAGSTTKAVRLLKSMGYKKVVNAGGMSAMARLGTKSQERET